MPEGPLLSSILFKLYANGLHDFFFVEKNHAVSDNIPELAEEAGRGKLKAYPFKKYFKSTTDLV